MREEAVRFSRTNPKDLPKESRFLLELDEDRFVTGDDWHTDKCYFLAAARAAMCAGRRRNSVSEEKIGEGMRRTVKETTRKPNRRFVGMRQFGTLDAKRKRKEVDKVPPFVAVRMNGSKRRVISGCIMAAMMRLNKRYKPRD